MPKDKSGKVVDKVVLTAEGKGSFGTIELTLDDLDPDENGDTTFTYTISEISNWSTYAKGDAKWRKSADVTVTVVARDDGKGGIATSVTYDEASGGVITNTYTPDKPDFEKKIQDANDSTGEKSVWQDSADYDIGDAVPFKLTAKLASDVTSYRKYNITFTDQMEDGLTFDEITSVTVGGKDVTNYVFNKTGDQNFTLALSWGDGVNTISDNTLNEATVDVYFTAILNEKANVGNEGNVNAAKLTYSNKPDNVDSTDQLPWDYVIAFTYDVDLSKVDQDGVALEGAEFKLDKVDSDGNVIGTPSLTVVRNTYIGHGLDDGIYVLTETKAPKGYLPIDPITFTVDATHEPEWGVNSAAGAPATFILAGRTDVLTDLTGKEETGKLDLEADADLTALSGSISNTKLGGIQITKKVTANGAEVTDKSLDGTYRFTVVGPNDVEGVDPKTYEAEIEIKDGKSGSATINDLVAGTYTVTEQPNKNGLVLLGGNDRTVTVVNGTNAKVETVEFTNTKPGTPDFEKKIADINDSIDTEHGPWQDSADYDIGDAVPYRLTATLAQDVTSYKKYHITFTDQMEDSLDFNEVTSVTVNGEEVSDYELTSSAHDFELTLSWAGADGATIADEALNGAEVAVEFNATLNDFAKLGSEGNVNAAKLSYSNNPASDTDGKEDEQEKPWDYVIAFTYKVDVNKVDPKGAALSGAEFKLEKKLADGTLQEIKKLDGTAGDVFSFKGLDDGTYILTETKAPKGYQLIAPITFKVEATHADEWDYTSKDLSFDGSDARVKILSKLTGTDQTGLGEGVV